MIVIVCVLVFAALVGCEDPQQTQTQAFENAESRYRSGEYDAALDGYQAFLEAYPKSPLAETAELRIRCIHREVRSVLMRKDTPRPRYVGAANGRAAGKPTTKPNQAEPAESSGDGIIQ